MSILTKPAVFNWAETEAASPLTFVPLRTCILRVSFLPLRVSSNASGVSVGVGVTVGAGNVVGLGVTF